MIRFDWDSMDNWFEEDEEVYVHPPQMQNCALSNLEGITSRRPSAPN